MATALQRYQLYVSHVGDETRSFFASLDNQPEEDVRAMVTRKGFGSRIYLAHIWLDFRKKMRQEADDEESLQRINRIIEVSERVSDAPAAGVAMVKVTLPARVSPLGLMRSLKGFLLPWK